MTTPVDDRVVLPLALTRDAADRLCDLWCADPWSSTPVVHREPCLQQHLAARDALLATAEQLQQVSGDCHDPVKHAACSGCSCLHHRQHNLGKPESEWT